MFEVYYNLLGSVVRKVDCAIHRIVIFSTVDRKNVLPIQLPKRPKNAAQDTLFDYRILVVDVHGFFCSHGLTCGR